MSSASSSSPSSSDFLYLSSLEEVKSSLPCRSGYRTADVVLLDGCSLTPEELVDIGYEPRIQVDLTEDAWAVVVESRDIIDNILMRKEVVYGINTGFGNFANVIVREDELKELQCNLVRSHAAGVGKPLSLESTRMLLCLRINILAKGHSGIRPESLKTMLLCLRHNCLSFVPAKGTVGASGDLAPLSHLALGMMGEGLMWNPKTSKFEDAASVLKEHNIPPLDLHAKEGLALINGTQLISCIGAEAVVRARNIARQADCVGALTVEVLHGSATPFHPYIHKARPHRGQGLVAGRVRELLNWGKTRSEIADSHKNCSKVQDSYTLRCLPQIHGVVHETISFVYSILLTELNSATDNPMIFAKGTSADRYGLSKEKLEEIEIEEAIQKDRKEMLLRGQQPSKSRAGSVSGSSSFSSPSHSHSHSHEHAEKGGGLAHGTYYDVHDGIILSGGNFHGEYPAKALDFLAIGIHEISNVSERRIERLVNPQLSGLPAFLTPKGGLNSGFMIAHCTAAALVSENKTLCHPASVDSLSTSAAQEDHVSMGGFAARKALKVVRHVEYCVAIELLCACQGLEFLRPLKTTAPLEKVYDLIRTVANKWDKDRYMTPDIEAVYTLLQENKIWEACKDFIDAKHHEFIPRG